MATTVAANLGQKNVIVDSWNRHRREFVSIMLLSGTDFAAQLNFKETEQLENPIARTSQLASNIAS